MVNTDKTNGDKFYLEPEFRHLVDTSFGKFCNGYKHFTQSEKIVKLVEEKLEQYFNEHGQCIGLLGSTMYGDSEQEDCRRYGHWSFDPRCYDPETDSFGRRGKWIPICVIKEKFMLPVVEGHLHWKFACAGNPRWMIRLEFVKLEASSIRRMVHAEDEGKWIIYAYLVPTTKWLDMDVRCQGHFTSQCTFAECHEDFVQIKEASLCNRYDLVSIVYHNVL